MEGIQTLERKDRQRESKTQLLLALKEEVVGLRKELADERDLMAKLTSWVQSTLKPSLVQLRTEQMQGLEAVRGEMRAAVAKLESVDAQLSESVTHNAKAAEVRLRELAQHGDTRAKELSERHEALTMQLQQTRTTVSAKFDSVVADLTKAIQSAQSVAAAATASAVERAARDTKEECARVLEQATAVVQTGAERNAALLQRSQEELRAFIDKEQAERMRHFALSAHDERQIWQMQLLGKVDAAAAATKADADAFRADLDARAKARQTEQTQWEQRKELWMSSFLKDSEASMLRATQQWTQQWTQWREEAAAIETQRAQQLAQQWSQWRAETAAGERERAHSQSTEMREWRARSEHAQREFEQKHAAQLADQIGALVQWQRTSAAADKEWKAAVWDTVTQWQERYGPVIRSFVANEKARLEDASHELSAAARAAFPVPAWMEQLFGECGMQRYAPLLCSHGFDSPAVVMALEERDLERLGNAMPLGHAKALLLHLRSKQMDAAERESRERQQREYEEAKARLQAELEAEWKGKLEVVAKLAESSAAEASRMEALRMEMERKDRDMIVVTSQLESIATMLKEQKRQAETHVELSKEVTIEATVVARATKEVSHESVGVTMAAIVQSPVKAAESPKAVQSVAAAVVPPPVKAVQQPVVAAAPSSTSPAASASASTAAPAVKAKKASSGSKTSARVEPGVAPKSAAAAAAALSKGNKQPRPVPPPPEASQQPSVLQQRDAAPAPRLKESDVVEWICALGEREPRGTRVRVLYKSLMSRVTDASDLPALAAAVSALRSGGSLAVSSKSASGAAGGAFDGFEILTYTPPPATAAPVAK